MENLALPRGTGSTDFGALAVNSSAKTLVFLIQFLGYKNGIFDGFSSFQKITANHLLALVVKDPDKSPTRVPKMLRKLEFHRAPRHSC